MRVLRFSQVSERTGLSRVAIWRLEKEKKFPKRVQLTPKTIGWFEEEINEWLESRPRAADAGSNKILTNNEENSLSNKL